jgi:phosphoglucosamine mutase
MVDEAGKLIDGDQLLYVLATDRKNNGALTGPVVGTVMSNLGLEHALRAMDIDFRRAAVGDRYVLEALRSNGGIIGGETSGHMLVLDKTTTGDGLISALQVLAIMRRTGKPLSELVAGMPKYPQTMVNVRTERRMNPNESTAIQDAVAVAEAELADKGRVVLRASGTEPVIRVMVEGEDADQVVSLAKRLASIVAEAAA